MDSLYLDIETRSFPGRMYYITVAGFYHEQTGLVQMLSPDITAESLEAALPDAEYIYTFNGNNFDLKVIEQFHGINLIDRYKSRDLMYDCRKCGLKGGLKVVEQRLGIQRTQPPLNNFEIQHCWSRWKHKQDEDALKTLLTYNEEDVMNLIKLRAKLAIDK
ncbi:MAG: ribonuclease H-like domain-containing protein [Thermoleophilia bacterium]